MDSVIVPPLIKTFHLVWNLIRGGTEGQCARVAMALARRGHVQRVGVFRREGYFLPMVEDVCGPVYDVGITGMARWQTVVSIRRLAARLRHDEVDVLHAWDADAAIFGQFAARLAGVPFITSRRDLGQIYPPHKVWLMRRADRAAVRVVANAQAIVDAFARRGDPVGDYRVIPNILDLPESDRLAGTPFSRAQELPEAPRVVMVARLDPEKDAALFLRAAAQVRAMVPQAGFVLAGDGVERPELERLARALNLGSAVCFLGDITEVPALLRYGALGVLTPSRNEGLSNTILEYMAAGLPVVATDCGGNRELVHAPRGGRVVPVGDAPALAAAIAALLADPRARAEQGAYNRARIEREFQPEQVAAQFEALYRDVLSTRPA